jgi:hypothetical protein
MGRRPGDCCWAAGSGQRTVGTVGGGQWARCVAKAPRACLAGGHDCRGRQEPGARVGRHPRPSPSVPVRPRRVSACALVDAPTLLVPHSTRRGSRQPRTDAARTRLPHAEADAVRRARFPPVRLLAEHSTCPQAAPISPWPAPTPPAYTAIRQPRTPSGLQPFPTSAPRLDNTPGPCQQCCRRLSTRRPTCARASVRLSSLSIPSLFAAASRQRGGSVWPRLRGSKTNAL